MLPPETEDTVVDISLKHIVVALGSVLIGSAVIGTAIVLTRDHIRFKRQKAFFDTFTNLITKITERS